jgi:membrane protease YdiL (CAAX protease family)
MLLALLGAALLLQPVGGAIGVLLAGGVPAASPGDEREADLAATAATDGYARTLAFAMAGALLAQVPVVVLVLRAAQRSAGRMRWPEAALLGAATAVVAFPVVAVTAIAGSALRERLTGVPTDVIAHDTLRLIVEAPSVWTTMLSLLAIVGAPVTEEVLYRGLGHGFLAALGAGAWTRIVVVSAFFALAHWASVAPPALAALFVLGISFGWVREKSGTLLAPIVAHALFNAANVALAT